MCDAASGGVFSAALVEERPGIAILEVSGAGAEAAFADEPGGHRWQRVPETEKRGRVHTSSLTVAILPVATDAEVDVRSSDFEWQATRGSGAGGQHRNKTSSAVILRHIPTGIVVRCESERSQHSNRRTAMSLLLFKLRTQSQEGAQAGRAKLRRDQVGRGCRGDKIRTVAVQRDEVVDHRLNKRWSYREYERGGW